MNERMQLVSKELRMDNVTYAPTMRVTIDMPLEVVQDAASMMGEDEVKMILGTELYRVLKS